MCFLYLLFLLQVKVDKYGRSSYLKTKEQKARKISRLGEWWELIFGPFYWALYARNSHSMETSSCCNSQLLAVQLLQILACAATVQLQGWGQLKYLYLVLGAKSWVLGTYLYLTLWNSKVLGTYLYLKARYLVLVQVFPSTFVKLICIFRLKFGICFLQKVTTKHHNHKLLKWFILCAHSMGSPDIKTGLPPLVCRPEIP